MFWQLFFPVFLLVLVIVLGRILYHRMKLSGPRFYQGPFYRYEKKLLREFTSMLSEPVRNQLYRQLDYFTNNGKYWRYRDDARYYVELYEVDDAVLATECRYPLKDDCVLGKIVFEVKGNKYEIVFQSVNGRLWGWTIIPAVKGLGFFPKIKVLEKKLLNDPQEIRAVVAAQGRRLAERRSELLSEIIQGAARKKERATVNMKPLLAKLNMTKTVLPQVYLELIGFADGMRLNELTICSSEQVLDGLAGGLDFIPLADQPARKVGVLRGNDRGELYFLSKETGELTPALESFEDILYAGLTAETFSS